MIELSVASVIYIMSPPKIASGGPELLHQLGYHLCLRGVSVYMVYMPGYHAEPVNPRYVKYGVKYIDDINDLADNVLIIPETMTEYIKKYHNIRKYVWWLSVDNFYINSGFIRKIFNRILLNVFGKQNYIGFSKYLRTIDGHLVQSEYAKSFLEKKKITNIYYLSDYLNKEFLATKTDCSQKEDIVVYNPLKGYHFTRKIIKSSPGIKFIPIQNMTQMQVINLLQKAKVYIDFGNHPGKDRIPREAVILNACLLTNLRGSAANNVDVPLSFDFKIADKSKSVKQIIKRIQYIFDNYSQENTKLVEYRKLINQEEERFIKEVERVFVIMERK